MIRYTSSVNAALLVTLVVGAALTGPLGTVGIAAAVDTVTGSPELTAVAPENRLVAGTESTVQVYVVNTGEIETEGPTEYEDLVQTARAVTLEAESDGPITVATGVVPVGTVAEGVSEPVPITLRVAEDADPGTYEIPVEFTYEYTSTVVLDNGTVNTTEQSETTTETLEVVVERRPSFSVESAETDLAVGDSGTISLELENLGGGDVTDASVTVSSPDPEVTFGSGTEQSETFIGDWEAGDTESVDVRARLAEGALIRPYTVNVVVTYRDEEGQQRTSQQLVTGIIPQQGADFEVTDTDAEVAIGDSGPITLELENVGDADAEGATVTVQSADPELTFGDGASQTETFVGDWEEGDTETVEVRARVAEDALVRPYAVNVIVSFENPNGERKNTSLVAGIVPQQGADFEVASTDASVAIGDTGPLTLELENVGEETAQGATVTVQSADSEITFGDGAPQSENFVGDWEPGETKTVDVRARVADGALVRPYSVNVIVSYENPNGERKNTSLVAGFVPQQGADFELADINEPVAVGSNGTISLALVNVGNSSADGATVTVQSTNPEVTFGTGQPQSVAYVGSWGANETKRVEFDTNISPDALARPYAVNVVVSYENPGGERKNTSLVAGLNPEAGPAFALTITESDLRVGGVGRLRGTVENVGRGAAQGVVLRLASDDPSVTPTDLEVAVGDLAPGQSAEFEYTIALGENTSPGMRRLPFAVSYRPVGEDTRVVDQVDVTATVGARDPAIAVAPRNATFEVDSSGQLVLEVTNTEDSPQTDVTVRITTEPPLSSEDAVAFIPRLGANETRFVAFDLEVSEDAVAKTQAVGVNVSYRDDAGRQLTTRTQQIPVEVVEPETTFPVLPAAVIGVALAGVAIWWYRRR